MKRRPKDPTLHTRYRLALVREADVPCPEAPLIRHADVVRFLWQHIFCDEPREVLVAVFVDARMRPNGHMIVSIGSLDHSLADPRAIFAAALLHGAHGLLIAHQHPSGDPTPSREDILVTSRLERACGILGIRFLDHLVLAGPDCWSACPKGW
jgi:DNA repair protein RadC